MHVCIVFVCAYLYRSTRAHLLTYLLTYIHSDTRTPLCKGSDGTARAFTPGLYMARSSAIDQPFLKGEILGLDDVLLVPQELLPLPSGLCVVLILGLRDLGYLQVLDQRFRVSVIKSYPKSQILNPKP